MELDVGDNNNVSSSGTSTRVSKIHAAEAGILDNIKDDESEVLG
jgi:hypothetical protein